MIKILNCVGIDRKFNLIMSIYKKPTIKIMLNGEGLDASLLRSGIRQGYLVLPFLFNIIFQVLVREIKQ